MLSIAELKTLKKPWYELCKVLNGSNSEKLDTFIQYFADLPKQGSAEWKAMRKGGESAPPVIGGSEISDVIKGSIGGLVSNKLAPEGKGFTGNIHTQWGNMFEELARRYFDKLLQTTTYETGSIPGLVDNFGNTIQSYSPDGINIIRTDVYKSVFGNNATRVTGEDFINLMEFKCPSVRIPVLGEVPPQYIAQPKIGACTLGFVEQITFMDSVFRKCNVRQFENTNKYSSLVHNKDISDEFPNPLAMGVIFIYNTQYKLDPDINGPIPVRTTPYVLNPHDIVVSATRVCNAIGNYDPDVVWSHLAVAFPDSMRSISDIVCKTLQGSAIDPPTFTKLGTDLGCQTNNKLFMDVLKSAVEGARSDAPGYKIYYDADMIIGDSIHDSRTYFATEVRKYINFININNYLPIGFIPWKLFKCVMVPMDVEPDFLTKHEPKIRDTVEFIWKKKIATATVTTSVMTSTADEVTEPMQQLVLSDDFLSMLVD